MTIRIIDEVKKSFVSSPTRTNMAGIRLIVKIERIEIFFRKNRKPRSDCHRSIPGNQCIYLSKSKHCKSHLRCLFRSSGSEVFCKKGVLRNFAKFTGKHLYQSLFLINIIHSKITGL